MQDLAVAAQPERTDMVLAVIRPDLRKYSALKKILCIQRPSLLYLVFLAFLYGCRVYIFIFINGIIIIIIIIIIYWE